MTEQDNINCPRCKKDQPKDLFCSQKRKTGLNSVCRNCLEVRQKYLKDHPEYLKSYCEKNRQRIRNYSKNYHRRTYKRKTLTIPEVVTGGSNDEMKQYVDARLDQFRNDMMKHWSNVSLRVVGISD